MNKSEALRTLGLDDSADMEDVKAAYHESVQILHPDKFARNKRLQERATEQFKHVQDAYDYLRRHMDDVSSPEDDDEDRTLHARLAGLQAAREQLVAQRDALLDRRHNAVAIAGAGAVVFFLLHRIPFMLALGGTALVWGIIDLVTASKNLDSLDDHLRQLEKQRQKLESQL